VLLNAIVSVAHVFVSGVNCFVSAVWGFEFATRVIVRVVEGVKI